MKFITTLLASSVLAGAVLSGQVSDSEIIKDIKGAEPATIDVKLEPKGRTERVFEDGAWVSYYRRNYHSEERTKFGGVSYLYFGGIQYILHDGAYDFDHLLTGEGHYEGFPEPDMAEVKAFLLAHGSEFFGHHYNKIVGSEIPEIELVKGEAWTWHSLQSASGKVKASFTVPISYTKLETAEHVYELRLYADGDKAVKRNVPWSRLGVSELSNEKRVIEVTEHSAQEVRAMPSLKDAAASSLADAELASLPDVGTLPVFGESKELFFFVHTVMMTKSANEIRAYLYHLVSSNCRGGSKVNMMTDGAQAWIDKLVANEGVYKKTHCEYPAIKHEQGNMIEMYDRKQMRKVRMSGVEEDGTWKLSYVEYYPAKASEVDAIASSNRCGAASDYRVEKGEVKAFAVGDAVDCEFSNGVFPCTVKKLDPRNSSRYYVELQSNGSGYWMDAQFLSPGKAVESASASELGFKAGDKVQCEFSNGVFPCTVTAVDAEEGKYEVALANGSKYWVWADTVSATEGYAVGDRVGVMTAKGYIPGTITKILGSKFLVSFDDKKSYGDTWVKEGNLKKL